MGFQIEFFPRQSAEFVDCREHQRTPDACALSAGGNRHLGQLVATIPEMLQSNRAADLAAKHGEQDLAAMIDDFRLRVRKHGPIDVFDVKELLEPFQVKAQECIRICRREIDNLQIVSHRQAYLRAAAQAANSSDANKGANTLSRSSSAAPSV